MGPHKSPYHCEGAYVYRLAAPSADHYFFINDDEAKAVSLDTGEFHYTSATDPVTGEPVPLDQPVALEAYSGRWIRMAK
jgi:beta-galactosidase